ncbi:MAG: VIT and VWA domain-containing protein [Polyangiaceae bacterium]
MKLARVSLLALCALSAFLGSCAGARVTTPPPKVEDAELLMVDPGGIGAVQTRNDRGEVGKLGLSKVQVTAKQTGDFAEVSVEHTFMSVADVPLEGTFRFPMPEGAIVTGLAMMVNGKMIDGELVENEKARKVYEEIVDAMQDPVLLEWEHGTTFKMRIFPIEPKQPKVVVMRYLVPLQKHGSALSFVQGTRAIDDSEKIPDLRIDWNGKTVHAAKDAERGGVLSFPAMPAPAALREDLPDATYTSVRISPDWSKVGGMSEKEKGGRKRWVIVADTSRSSLEERKLQLTSLRSVLGGLPKDSQFMVAVSDLDTRAPADATFVPATPDHIESAIRYVEGTDPDGATDLGAMLTKSAEFAGKAGAEAGIIYLGDCEASWGTTDAAALRKLAQTSLAKTPFYPIVLGNSSDPDTARELAAATSGRMVRARSPEDLTRFLSTLAKAPKRLSDVELVQQEHSVMLPASKTTLDEGEELVALVRTEHGKAPPTSLVLRARAGEAPVEMPILVNAVATPNVARRFGSAWVRELERNRKPKDEIVNASKAFSVMSKHTSFLVLDSEEAYAAHDIARKAAQRDGAPRISSIDGDGAHISLDRIQPGDPEIMVNAPRDAARVVVVLPNGETKTASYDPDANGGRGAWMVRFLVDQDTREGTYDAEAIVFFVDGRREVQKVHYTVDKTPPELEVQMKPASGKPGTWQIDVTQKAPKSDVDVRRVEVQTPDGMLIELTAIKWGEFRGFWKPSGEAFRAGGSIHVVGFDSALNHRAVDIAIPVP